MRTKGLGPQGLGISGNNGYHIGSPNKMVPVVAAAAGGGAAAAGAGGAAAGAGAGAGAGAAGGSGLGSLLSGAGGGGGGGKKATTSRSSGDPGASMNAAPIKCWKTHKRKPGTVKGAKGSCIKK